MSATRADRCTETLYESREASETATGFSDTVRGQKLGYARWSTDEQSDSAQAGALAGCDRVFTDAGVSGAVPLTERKGWTALLAHARAGDTVAVYRLDRLSRGGIRATLEVAEMLRARGIGLTSVSEGLTLDASPVGEIVLAVLAWAAQQERAAIRARTKAALAERRAAGVRLGRPPALTTEQRRWVRGEIESGALSVSAAARLLGVSRATVHRVLAG